MGLFSKAKEMKEDKGLLAKAAKIKESKESNTTTVETKRLAGFAKLKRKGKINHFIRACNIFLASISKYNRGNNFSDEKMIQKIEWFDYQVEAIEQALQQMGIKGPKIQRLRLSLKYFGKIKLMKKQNIKDKIFEQNLEALKKKTGNKNVSEAALRQKATIGVDSYKNNLTQLSVMVIQYKDALVAIKKSI